MNSSDVAEAEELFDPGSSNAKKATPTSSSNPDIQIQDF